MTVLITLSLNRSSEVGKRGNSLHPSLKRTYSPIHLFTYSPHKKVAFTLAEVLITLGIIGVVAAMTIPALMTDYRKETTAARVKKFYSVINNAVMFAAAEHGDVSVWMSAPANLDYNENLNFVQIYLMPYIKYTRYDNCYGNSVCVYMADGGMFFFSVDYNGGDIVYFVNGKFDYNIRNVFAFQFNKINGTTVDGEQIVRPNNKTTVEPYVFELDGTYETLINDPRRGCSKARETTSTVRLGTFCTKLLQMNGWKITDDFPW